MAKIVDEIMNKELFCVRSDDTIEDVAGLIMALGVTGTAVVEAGGKPIGHASLRDMLRADGKQPISSVMNAPAATVPTGETIEATARRMVDANRHRLIVVDAEGRAAGMVSALDAIRGFLGLPAVHPPGFPHFDASTGLSWSDDTVLDETGAELAPDGPGILLLVHGGACRRERPIFAEACQNVRTRIDALLSAPSEEPPLLQRALRLGNLRFRAAFAADPAVRERALQVVLTAIKDSLAPSAASVVGAK